MKRKEKQHWDPGLKTWEPYVLPGTQDPPRGILHLRLETKDPYMGRGIQALCMGHGPWDPSTGIRSFSRNGFYMMGPPGTINCMC